MINRRLDTTCRIILPVIFVMFIGCTLFFNHTHISDGNIIVHSHPFNTGQDGKPLHTHKDYSYNLIHFLNNLILTTAPFIVLAELYLILIEGLIEKLKQFHLKGNWALQSPLRGPPSVLF